MDEYDPKYQVSDRFTGNYSHCHGASYVTGDTGIHVNDAIIMSTTEMLKNAGEHDGSHDLTFQGYNVFIHGCLLPVAGEEAKYVRTDLKKDEVEFSVDNINIPIDIDSIIWTINEFACRDSIGIYMTPIYDNEPGIAELNH